MTKFLLTFTTGIAFIVCMRFNVFAQNNIGGISLSMGRNTTAGFYSDYYNDGWFFSFGILYQLPILHENLFSEIDFYFDQRAIKDSTDSHLRTYGFRAGTGFFWPFWRYAIPYFGLYFQESYLQLYADTLDRTESSFKPGFALKAGVLIPVHSAVLLRPGFEYSYTEISDKSLYSIILTFSAVFHIPQNAWKWESSDKTTPSLLHRENPDELFQIGNVQAEAGEAETAERTLRKVLKINPGHQDAKLLLEKIDNAKKNHIKASALIAENKYFEAIEPLEKSIPYIKTAGSDLNIARAKLLGEIPGLERIGIEAYEKKEYARCITIMNRIKTIDPNNATVVLYLPRAIRRKEAIDRLK